MDILDEVDAAIHEKRSKWNYTPMREKSETDAIIDELLREFSNENSSTEKTIPAKRSAVKTSEKIPDYIVPPDNNNPKSERAFHENSVNISDNIPQEQYAYSQAMPQERYEQSPQAMPERSAYQEQYPQSTLENDIPQNMYERSPQAAPQEKSNDSDDYNEYISQKYAQARYRDEEIDDPDHDDEYEEYEEEYDEEYAPDFPESYEDNKISDMDFNAFMDSENDGKKDDIPSIAISTIIKTVLKILILAVFGTFSVVGIINIADRGVDKFGKSSSEKNIKEELQSVIYPLIVTETEDFQNASELSNEQIVNICVWEVVINGKISAYKAEDSDDYIMPQDQMKYIVDKLFGDGVDFSDSDSKIGQEKITYEKKKKQYVIPENTDLYTFYPVVTDVAETSSGYMVYANCFSAAPSWNGEKQTPSKRIIVTLDKTKEYYNIKSLKTIPLE